MTFDSDPTLAQTTAGVVRGQRDGSVIRWRGIPYAAAPVGARRLRVPEPVEPWDGVRDAIDFAPAAPQNTGDDLIGLGAAHPTDEDCLYLNVAVPRHRGPAPLPVVVWIHGGAYYFGAASSPSYEPSRIVTGGRVIVVGINYRLGALGWLDLSRYSTEERPIDSNLGLRDQVAALQWVHDNIAAFGGDPDRVTIMGESAGATSVLTLMAIPAARGLFSRAVAESPAVASVYSKSHVAEWAGDFVRILGATDDTASEALATATAEQFVSATQELVDTTPETEPARLALCPVIDGDYLPMAPLDAARAGEVAPVPLLIGTNGAEGVLFQRRIGILPTDERKMNVLFAENPDVRSDVVAAYAGYPKPRPIADLAGDLVFWEPSIRFAEAHALLAPTWMYRFDFSTRVTTALGLDATHGAELAYIWDRFDTVLMRSALALGPRRRAREVADRMQRVWWGFLRGEDPDLPRYDPVRRATWIIDAVDRIDRDPDRARRIALTRFAEPFAENGRLPA